MKWSGVCVCIATLISALSLAACASHQPGVLPDTLLYLAENQAPPPRVVPGTVFISGGSSGVHAIFAAPPYMKWARIHSLAWNCEMALTSRNSLISTHCEQDSPLVEVAPPYKGPARTIARSVNAAYTVVDKSDNLFVTQYFNGFGSAIVEYVGPS